MNHMKVSLKIMIYFKTFKKKNYQLIHLKPIVIKSFKAFNYLKILNMEMLFQQLMLRQKINLQMHHQVKHHYLVKKSYLGRIGLPEKINN